MVGGGSGVIRGGGVGVVVRVGDECGSWGWRGIKYALRLTRVNSGLEGEVVRWWWW
jgi:hypothetical protein